MEYRKIKMNKKTLLLSLIFTAFLIPLFSQSNEELDRFLSQDKADLATSAWLIYLSAEILPYDATPADAMEYLMASENGSIFQDENSEALISYSEFAYLIMSIHKLPGGLFYNIFHSPRYAAKEMSYRRWMPGDPKPGALLTPWDVTTSISQVLNWKEAQQ
jgi:hypothetical protein